MRKKLPYKLALANIKNYLINEGIKIDNMIMYQGGFIHDGYNYGLEIIATFETNGVEERYYAKVFTLYIYANQVFKCRLC